MESDKHFDESVTKENLLQKVKQNLTFCLRAYKRIDSNPENIYMRLHDLLNEKLRGKEVLATPYDIPASEFIEKLAKYLKENVEKLNPPSWASFAKTGAHVQRQPQDPDWWYIRCASLLRKIYIHSPIGVERLKADYGGRKDFGVKPEHVVKAGGAIIRKALQQLEAAGLVETLKPRGRRVTREGRKLLQEVAEDIQKKIKGSASKTEEAP